MKETTAASLYFDPRQIEIVTEVHGKEGRFNPRTLVNPGFTAEKMDDLRKGIVRDGLNHAILVRLVHGKPKLVAGERRLRAVLGLLEADEESVRLKTERVLCKNPRTKKLEPALVVYGEQGVECKITDADEKESLRQAIQENTLHEGLTDYELLLQCEKMEKAGITRAEQAEAMGVSEAWISQSHSLLEANDKILHYMERQLLTRTAALTFLNVAPEKVSDVLCRAIDLTYQEAEQKQVEAEGELVSAREDLQHGESALRLSQYTGNVESERKARRQVARASRATEKAEKKVEEIQQKKKKKVTVETIKQAAKDVNAAENLGQPQSTRHLRIVVSEVAELLVGDGEVIIKDEQKFDRHDVELVHGVLQWMVNRNHCDCPLDVIQLVRSK